MLRLATPEDAETIFTWRNRPEVIELSTLKKAVTWPEHLQWYKEAIKGTDTLLYIIESDIGMVRLDRIGAEAFISITILDEYQGKGLGICAINSATREAFSHWDIKRVVAHIREDNERSIKVFKKCSYFEELCSLDGHREFVSL